jgi:hypothetical protein
MAEVTSTFILRLWSVNEPLAEELPQGRGRIDHVQSGEYIYFDHVVEAMDFLRRHFGAYASLELPPPEPAPTAGDQPPEGRVTPDIPEETAT